MQTAEIASPRAAELYFNNSLIGHLSSLLAETLRDRREAPARGPSRHESAARREQPATRPQPSLLDRLDAWLWRQEQKSREAYLARSRDLFELERRMDALDRGAFVRYY